MFGDKRIVKFALDVWELIRVIIRNLIQRLVLLIVFVGLLPAQAGAQVDFPIGYVSTGGTYAFISLIEQHKLLEQEGIRPTFVYNRRAASLAGAYLGRHQDGHRCCG